MANLVGLPSQYYADPQKSRPVFNGQIFVGQPDTDPEIPANQKQISVSDIGTGGDRVNVSQPLALGRGGVPIFNNAPVSVFVDGNYSIKVLDSRGRQVYYFADVLSGVPITTSTLPQFAPTIVGTFTDLRNLNPSIDGQQFSLLGHTNAGVGGGIFYYDADDTTSTDNNGTVVVTTLGQRLKRILDGYVTPEMFGAVQGSDISAALVAADTFCQSSQLTMVGGSSGGTLSSTVTLRAPYIDLGNYTITIDSALDAVAAVIYEGTSNDLEHTSIVSMRFNGQRGDRSQDITSFLLRKAPSSDSLFYIYGRECNTLCNVDGNVERMEMHIKGVFTDTILLETGTSPDTNRYYISGGQYGRAYHKTSSTTSQVVFNCQSQEDNVGVYAIDISGGRGTTISGELRVVSHGVLRMADVPNNSNSFLNFDSFHTESVNNSATVAAFDIDTCNNLQGSVSMTVATGLPCHLKEIRSADFSLSLLDCSHEGYHVIFGEASSSSTCVGSYRIVDRGASASSEAALFDRVGSIDAYFDGSSLPIDVTSTVNNDVINLSVEQSYINDDVRITTNNVRVNCNVRGMFLTTDILAYSTPFRGMNCLNLNTNGLVFYDGTNWQRYTSSILI